MKQCRKKTHWQGYLYGILLVFAAVAMSACSDSSSDNEAAPYDPTKPISISRLFPEECSALDQLIIYGSNFGTDKKALQVTIGGKPAVVVSVAGDKIYCFVPSGAFSGEVEVSVTDDQGNVQHAESPTKITYLRKKVVSTLCGKTNETGDQGTQYGPFATCTGFTEFGSMAYDPQDPNILYIVYDESDRGIEVLDFKTREYYQLMSTNPFSTRRLRGLDFTNDGKYMLVAVDNGYDERDPQASVYVLTRNTSGTFKNVTPQRLTFFGQCNTVAVHPNGEIYFNSYNQGQVFRFELENYLNALNWTPDLDNPEEEAPVWDGKIMSPTAEDKTTGFEEVFQIKDSGNEFRICIHPSGKYAYLVVVNKHYILRTDYNEQTKRFTVPYTVAGAEQTTGWVDAVGTSARINRPYNGVFVKNPEYEAQGRDDVYDFYFTDCLNFCVRYLTPDGVVRTFAGRGKATNGNIWGTEDGDMREVARFRDVSGIAYSQQEDAFYVLDQFNARIRRIGVEVEQDEVIAGDSTTE